MTGEMLSPLPVGFMISKRMVAPLTTLPPSPVRTVAVSVVLLVVPPLLKGTLESLGCKVTLPADVEGALRIKVRKSVARMFPEASRASIWMLALPELLPPAKVSLAEFDATGTVFTLEAFDHVPTWWQNAHC